MASAEKVYLNYDQAGLDAQYDNVRKNPEFDFNGYLKHMQSLNAQALDVYESSLERGLRYGDHEDETLDLFVVHRDAPLHIFFHGGYWRMLHKDDFSYVALGIIPNGVNLAVVNYSLIPKITMGQLIAQCRQAIQWLLDRHDEKNFDPTQVSISGHSAGGHLAAMMAATQFRFPGGIPGFSHVCAMSGIFDLAPIRKSFLNDTLALQISDVQNYSPVRLRRVHPGPMSIVTGAQEGEEYSRQAAEMVDAWSPQGAPLKLCFPDGYDHFNLRSALADPQSVITKLALGV